MAIKVLKALAVILIIALLAVVSVNLVIYKEDNSDKAIILIHGTMGGGLVDSDGNPVWDPFGGGLSYKNFLGDPISMALDILFGQEYTSKTSAVINDILSNDPNGLIYRLTSDEDGNVKNNGIVAATQSSALPFGPLNAYKDIYDGLFNEFNKDIEVVMFQYDWREDNRVSAKHLEDFINENGWDEVIICAHSMGNIVTSDYLARSKENRDKVRGYMAMAGPFFGATAALTVLEDPGVYIDGITDMINDTPTLKYMLGNKVNMIVNQQILPLIHNMASVGQLLPTIEYAKALKEYYGEEFITVDGKEITTNKQLVEFYLSRPWAKKTNGQLKAFMADLESFMDSCYVEENGVKYHSSELVNTFYFAGTGVNTGIGITIENNSLGKILSAPLGDGTVPLYSATLGKDPDKCSNVKIYDGKTHLDMGMLYEGKFAGDISAAIRYLL